MFRFKWSESSRDTLNFLAHGFLLQLFQDFQLPAIQLLFTRNFGRHRTANNWRGRIRFALPCQNMCIFSSSSNQWFWARVENLLFLSSLFSSHRSLSKEGWKIMSSLSIEWPEQICSLWKEWLTLFKRDSLQIRFFLPCFHLFNSFMPKTKNELFLSLFVKKYICSRRSFKKSEECDSLSLLFTKRARRAFLKSAN